MRRLFVRNILYIALLGLLFSFPGAVAHAETETPAVPEKGWSLSEDGILTVAVDTDSDSFRDMFETAAKERTLRAVVFAEGVTKTAFFDFFLTAKPSPCVDSITIPSTMTDIAFDWGPLLPSKVTVAKENPVYYVENGLLIDRVRRAVVYGGYSLTHAEVPEGIVEIDSYAFFWHKNLRSVSLPEGLRYINSYAFYDCTALKDVRLPLSLRGVCKHAFTDCTALRSVVLPPNLRMCVSLDGDRCIFTDSGVRTLVFTSPHINFCKGVIDSCDALRRLVFLREPPIVFSDWMFERLMENTGGRAEILYRKEYRADWSPNGESAWCTVPMRAMTEAEEREIKKLAGDLWDAEWTDDAAAVQGWSYAEDHSYTLTVFSDAGMDDFARVSNTSFASVVRTAEGVSNVRNTFRPPFDGILDELHLANSVTNIEDGTLDNFLRVYLRQDNPHFRIADGCLTETATGRMLQTEASLLYEPAAPIPAPAATGDGWSLSEDGVLTVTTDGGLRVYKDDDSYARAHHLPQADCRAIVFAEGVTRIDLTECWTSEYMDIPSTVREILPLEGMLSALAVGEFRVSADNLYYYVENGMLIDRAAQTVLTAEYGLTDAVVPDGVLAIGAGAFSGHAALRSVRFSDSVREIHERAFEDCAALTELQLPTRLRAIYDQAFVGTSIRELALPPDVRLYEHGDGPRSAFPYTLETLVVTGGNASVFTRETLSLECLTRLIFLSPPEGFPQSIAEDLQRLGTYNRAEFGDEWLSAFSICYPAAQAAVWSPNGEKERYELRVRRLTDAELREAERLCGSFWGAEPAEPDAAAYPGWSLDGACLTIWTDAGLDDYVRHIGSIGVDELVLAEGVTRLTAELYDGWFMLRSISLPSTLRTLSPDALNWMFHVSLAPGNPYFLMRGGYLIRRGTYQVVRRPIEKRVPSFAAPTSP